MPAPRDHYRYLLYHQGRIVYIGITNDPERREQEHRYEGKRFTSMSVLGPAVTRASAEHWEEQRREQYRRNHGAWREREEELKHRIEVTLGSTGLRYDVAPALGGVRPDFLVHGPEGQTVVIEAKGWSSSGGGTARARDQASKYKEVTGADAAFVVLPELARNYKDWNVVSLDGLTEVLEDVFAQVPGQRPRRQLQTAPVESIVFAAMPFQRRYDDTFFVAMTHAASKVDATCQRVDKEEFAGDIVEEIKRLIQVSIAVIADLSESKPNVLYEAGYAHALEKPTVHISATPLEELPFDVRNWNTIPYDLGQTAALRRPLTHRLRALMG